MLVFVEIFAATLYLLPVATWTSVRAARRGPSDGRFAVELSLVVAADLLSVLLLARRFTLETATLVSRLGWLVAAGLAVRAWWRAGGRPRRPSTAHVRRFVELALVVVGAVLFSQILSRPCAIWDRDWHIPLVTSLRGQHLPFMNVNDPTGGLFYHFTGDVQAAMLQTLSGGRLHASLALSLSHDVMFALIALNVVSFLRAMGIRRTLLGAVVALATVTIGPVTLLRDAVYKLNSGFSLMNLLTMSFRPHVPLAYLLELGFIEAALGALLAPEPSDDWRPRVGVLAILAATLAITDEASLAMLGVALGVLWLANPAALAPTRRAGLLALGALVLAIGTSLVIYGGSIGPSAPHYHMALVAPHSPGFMVVPQPLSTRLGWAMLYQDLLPIIGALAALAIMAVSKRERAILGSAIFYAALAVTSVVALTCLEFEGDASESHRFTTALFISTPLLVAVAINRYARTISLGAATGGIAALAAYVTMGLGVASTVEWLGSGVAYGQCVYHGLYGWSSDRFYDVDCRSEVDATLGETTSPTYVDADGFYLWAGCHPIFASAPPILVGEHKVKVHGPWFGRPAINTLYKHSAPFRGANVVCLTVSRSQPDNDPACGQVARLSSCRPRGPSFISCSLDRPALATLAGKI